MRTPPGRRVISRLTICSALLVATWVATVSAEEQTALPSGDAAIRAPYGDSGIVITTTSRLAGAIHSLTWNGQEFIDSTDHGRQLQSASNFDAGSAFVPETFNPTEAGSVDDGAGSRSSSRLLHLIARDDLLQTTTQMAFWLSPTGRSLGHPARNGTVLSNHLLTKRVQIGYKGLPNVIQYDVTFGLPLGEKHAYAQFEAVTGYMPIAFQAFWLLNPASKQLEPLSDGPGEQPHPVILSTANGSHAMGVVARNATPTGMTGPGYGRFRFTREKVVKWNCVYRLRDDQNGVAAADYSFRQFVVIGDLESVKQTMIKLLDGQRNNAAIETQPGQ